MGSIIFFIIGVSSILYCIAIAMNGFGTRFFLIWGLIGICACLFGAVLSQKQWLERIPTILKRIFIIAFTTGSILFIITEVAILTGFTKQAVRGADYCVVLGAQWKRSGPSAVLKFRLDKAVTYLRENPDTLIVVTGGKGSNEIIAEADGMKGYLMNAGIDEGRILVENRSTNTCENLQFTASLIDKENSSVVIVTNNFHMFRALGIAKKQGYHAQGLAADSVLWMLPNNLLREFFGVMKDTLFGNMKWK